MVVLIHSRYGMPFVIGIISDLYVTYKSDWAGFFTFLTINYRKTMFFTEVKNVTLIKNILVFF